METSYLFYSVLILIGITFNSVHNHLVPRIISFRTASAFLLSWGLSGLLCLWGGKDFSTQLISGLSAGLLTAGIGYLIMSLIYQKKIPADASDVVARFSKYEFKEGSEKVNQKIVSASNVAPATKKPKRTKQDVSNKK